MFKDICTIYFFVFLFESMLSLISFNFVAPLLIPCFSWTIVQYTKKTMFFVLLIVWKLLPECTRHQNVWPFSALILNYTEFPHLLWIHVDINACKTPPVQLHTEWLYLSASLTHRRADGIPLYTGFLRTVCMHVCMYACMHECTSNTFCQIN